jgi:hypothetical protein
MQRYGVVLQELRLEVLRNNVYLASISTPQAGGGVGDERDLSHLDILHDSQVNQPGLGHSAAGSSMDVDGGLALRGARQFDQDHASGGMGGDSMDGTGHGLDYMASWGQFDSLVCPESFHWLHENLN